MLNPQFSIWMCSLVCGHVCEVPKLVWQTGPAMTWVPHLSYASVASAAVCHQINYSPTVLVPATRSYSCAPKAVPTSLALSTSTYFVLPFFYI